MLERFLTQTRFVSHDDFMQNYEVRIPEHFNFAYDVIDAWAEEARTSVLCCGPTRGARSAPSHSST